MIIAGMATIPDRESLCRKAVKSIIGQVDRLYVYANGITRNFWDSPKIEVTFSRDAGWKGNEAKFWWSAGAKFRQYSLPDVDVMFTVDDDIIYPPDYVKTMIAALDRHPGCAVGVHGARIREPVRSYYGSLDISPFQNKQQKDRQVHLIGTATLAYRPKDFKKFDFEKFYIPNMADPWFASLARENDVKLWTVARKDRWLVQQQVTGVSISAMRSGGRTQAETELLQLLSPWPVCSDR